ncbi:hypothetical protein RvY_04880 [Ramazzottius varieornatus]|uniref:Uncharacterized protein n=1 Tax=Ramazzottius varieornatus TaxID=947166 RepID=A0A1D1UT45_RAMVA|nr:hypothetical protein RvY_04880 [Ramazzottius varieornatus]
MVALPCFFPLSSGHTDPHFTPGRLLEHPDRCHMMRQVIPSYCLTVRTLAHAQDALSDRNQSDSLYGVPYGPHDWFPVSPAFEYLTASAPPNPAGTNSDTCNAVENHKAAD